MKKLLKVLAAGLLTTAIAAQADPSAIFDKTRAGLSITPKEAEKYHQLALKGEPKAEFIYGEYLVTHGIAGHGHTNEGMNWVKKAADQGLGMASLNYAMLIYSGYGGEPDLQEARKYFQKSLDQGLSDKINRGQATFFIGFLDTHDANPSVRQKGIETIKKAANMNNSRACLMVSSFYMKGSAGFPKNTKKMLDYAHKATINAVSGNARQFLIGLAGC